MEQHIDITYAHGIFSEDEMNVVDEAFSSLAPVKRQYIAHYSAERMAAIIIISVGFVGSAIATGFFKAIGSDLYKQIKEAIEEAIKNKEKLSINFKMESNRTTINIKCSPKDKNELEQVFDTINEAKELAILELSKSTTPKMTEINLIYDNGWTFLDGMFWDPPINVAFYEYVPSFWKRGNTWYIENGVPHQRK